MICGLSKEQIQCLFKLKDTLHVEMDTLIYYYDCCLNDKPVEPLHKDLYQAFLNRIQAPVSTSIILTRASGDILKDIASKLMDKSFFATLPGTLKVYKEDKLSGTLLHLFLSLFPTADAEKNSAWNTCFQTTWNNVTLRRISPGAVTKFKKIIKSKDIGLFIFGTYLFIINSYNAGRNTYFVKNIDNYFKEYDHWYDVAKETLSKHTITQQPLQQTQSSNFIVI
jgi:hypothetical protein